MFMLSVCVSGEAAMPGKWTDFSRREEQDMACLLATRLVTHVGQHQSWISSSECDVVSLPSLSAPSWRCRHGTQS